MPSHATSVPPELNPHRTRADLFLRPRSERRRVEVGVHLHLCALDRIEASFSQRLERGPLLLQRFGDTLLASLDAPLSAALALLLPPMVEAENWRGRPLESLAVIVDLIGHTTTEKGLKIRAEIDTSSYPKGQTVSDEAMKRVHLQPDAFHGEWNYSILPGAKS